MKIGIFAAGTDDSAIKLIKHELDDVGIESFQVSTRYKKDAALVSTEPFDGIFSKPISFDCIAA